MSDLQGKVWGFSHTHRGMLTTGWGQFARRTETLFIGIRRAISHLGKVSKEERAVVGEEFEILYYPEANYVVIAELVDRIWRNNIAYGKFTPETESNDIAAPRFTQNKDYAGIVRARDDNASADANVPTSSSGAPAHIEPINAAEESTATQSEIINSGPASQGTNAHDMTGSFRLFGKDIYYEKKP